MRCRAQWFRCFVGWFFVCDSMHTSRAGGGRIAYLQTHVEPALLNAHCRLFENTSWKNLLFMQLTLMTGFIYYIVAFALACARHSSCIAADKLITAQKLIKDDTEGKSSGTQNNFIEANGNFAHRMTMHLRSEQSYCGMMFRTCAQHSHVSKENGRRFRGDKFWMNNEWGVRVVWFDYWINGCVVPTDY